MMRDGTRGLTAALIASALVCAAVPAWSQDAVEPTSPAVSYAEPSPLTLAVLRDITNRKAGTTDAEIVRWLDALGSFYAERTDGPLWVGEDGWTQRARKVVAELRKAGDWGLDASKIAIPYEPTGLRGDTDAMARAEAGLTAAVLTYASHANGGRFDPKELSLWFDQRAQKFDAVALLQDLADSPDAGQVLRDLHPQHPQFKALHKAYLAMRYPSSEPEAEVEEKPRHIILERAGNVYPGKRHPQIALLRKRLGVLATADNETLYDRRLVAEVNRYMRTMGWRKKRVFDNKVRAALNDPEGYLERRKGRKQAKSLGPITEKQLLVNMEKWRWMPRDLGELHIWNNLPEFRTQVVRNDEVVHEERIIIGKTSLQTPVFSDKMTHVVFKPEWGIPSSIKIKSLLPRLASGDYDVLRRRGMRISINGKTVSPSRYNWATTDITRIPIIQGPGPSNPLGRMKFMFPNKHAVYMHDTPDKHLFENRVRTHSSGCIRVRNPQRFAEVVMSEASRLTANDVSSYLSRGAQQNNRVDLDRPVAVHNTYFTIVADENGKLKRLSDIYGHDNRIAKALSGVSASVIARSDPARIHAAKMKHLAEALPRRYRQDPFAADPFFEGPTWSFGFQPQQAYNPNRKSKRKKYTRRYNSMVRPFWNTD